MTTTESFVTSVKVCFTKYVDFKGRASRAEFWWFALFQFIVGNIFFLIHENLNAAYSLATILPALAVGVRRLHDRERSGWWQLLLLVPIIGWIILFIWFCRKGTNGTNRYGIEPLSL